MVKLELETNNFAFEVKVTLGQESAFQEDKVVRLGLNGPQD